MNSVQFRLDVGETIKIKDQLWKVHSFASNGDHNLVNPAENRFERKTDTELVSLWKAGDLETVPIPANDDLARRVANLDVPFDSWPENVKKIARKRYWYVKAYSNRYLRRKSKALLAKLIKEVANENKDESPPSVRQLQRWVKLWNDLGSPDLADIRILAPQFHKRGRQSSIFHWKVERIMEEVIEELYLTRTPDTLTAIEKEIRRRVRLIDFSDFDAKYMDGELPRCPKRTTIHRTVNTLDFDVRVEAREGRYARIRKCEPVVRGPRPERALAEVEIDHTLTDWILFDYKRMVPLGRPWLILILDRATRCILGYLLTFKKPSAADVMRCMKMMMLPKDYIPEKYPDIKHPWKAWGKPGTIIVDNGAEFHSANFLDNLFVHQIDMQACPVCTPQFKGRVERAIRTLMEGLCHIVPGTTFSNIVQRGDYQSEKLAVVDVEAANYLIHKYICDIYHQNFHRGIGMSPAAKWEENVAKYGPPKPPARIKEIHELALVSEYKRLTREGIEWDGIKYCDKSPELRELFNRGDKPAEVKCRRDPEDLNYVLIEDWRTHQYLRVPSIYPEYTVGLAEAAHEVYKQYAKKSKNVGENLSIEDLCEAKRIIREKLKFLVKHKKALGKKLEGVFGQDVVPDIVREIEEESVAEAVCQEEDRSGEVVDIDFTSSAPKRRKLTVQEQEERKAEIVESMTQSLAAVAVTTQRRAANRIVPDFD